MSRKQSFSLPGLKAQSSKLARHSGEGLWAKMGKQIAHLCYPELGVNCCSVEQTEEDVGYKSPQSPPALGGRFLQGAGTDSLSVQQQLLPAQGEGKKIPRNAINTFYKCWSWGLTKILQDIRKIAQVRCLWANFWFSEEFCTLRHWEVKPDLSTEEIHINIRDLHLHLWKPQRSGPGRVFFFFFHAYRSLLRGEKKIRIFSEETLIVFTGEKFILLKRNDLLGKGKELDGKMTTYQKLISSARLAETEWAGGREKAGKEGEQRCKSTNSTPPLNHPPAATLPEQGPI